MKDYTLQKSFWSRLKMFVGAVQVNDPMSEEEQEMIIGICKEKLSHLTPKRVYTVRLERENGEVIYLNSEEIKKWEKDASIKSGDKTFISVLLKEY